MESQYVNNLSLFEKAKLYFVNPAEFFEQNKLKSRWLVLFLMMITINALLQGRTFSLVMGSGLDGSLGIEQEATLIVNKISLLLGAITGGIGSVISILFTVLIIYLSVKYVVKGEIKYREAMSVYCFASIPVMIFNMLSIIVYGKTENILGLDATVLIIKYINPLSLWFFVMLIIGIAKVSNISIKKSIILFVVFAFLNISFTAGSFYISQEFKGSDGANELFQNVLQEDN